jgi:hypothetical protein
MFIFAASSGATSRRARPRIVVAVIALPLPAAVRRKSLGELGGLDRCMAMSSNSPPATRITDDDGPGRLDPRDVELIATRVAEILSSAESRSGPARLADAATVAARLGVDRSWVYAHARELGAVRLGSGRGRLRFDLERAQRAICPDEPVVKRGRPRRSSRPAAQVFEVELVPYRPVSSPPTVDSGRAAR